MLFILYLDNGNGTEHIINFTRDIERNGDTIFASHTSSLRDYKTGFNEIRGNSPILIFKVNNK